MSTSEDKIVANRVNAQKSTGPKNAASTRFNAAKHGLLALGVTELDDPEDYSKTLEDLKREKNPVGVMETCLVESAALDVIRLKRARRLEAEYITAQLNQPTDELESLCVSLTDPGLPAAIDAVVAQKLVNTYQRYETTISARLLRNMHELERLQRMRQGENVAAPIAVDVSLGTEGAGVKPGTPFAEVIDISPMETSQ